jgi:phage terminase large subunit-like protein
VGASIETQLARLSPAGVQQFLTEQATEHPWALNEMAAGEWWYRGRPEQQAPPGRWFVWLLLSGRGFGKTRTAAEWLVDRVLRFPADVDGFRTEWLLIAETMADAERQCVEGPAGVRRVLERRLGAEKRNQHDTAGKWKLWKGTKTFIELATGQVIYIEGADDEDVGRGYNASGAWLDEFAKWKKPDGSWKEGIMPSLRADLPGDHPRAIVATTPKLVQQLMTWEDRAQKGDGKVVVTRGSTYDNAANLSAPMLAELHETYHGTRLGEQELHGKLIREVAGALWSYDWIKRDEVEFVPYLDLRVVGMDPGGTGERDETGLVCTGRAPAGDDYVLGDWSAKVAGAAAMRRAWEMVLAYAAHFLVVESNMAKKWVSDSATQVFNEMQNEGHFPKGMRPPIKMVNAKVGKKLRAEPVATRYEQPGRIHHVRNQGLHLLETQQCTWVPEETKDSPDRVDALVYAELEHFARERLKVGTASAAGVQLPRTSLSPLQ